MTNAFSWIVTRLSVVLVPLWILAAVAAVMYLPEIRDYDDSPLGGLVPGGTGAISTEQREYKRFGTTLLTRVAVVQRDPDGLTRAQLRRTVRVALQIDRRRAPLLRNIAFAAPLLSRDRTTTITYLYYRPEATADARVALADTYSKRLVPPGKVTGALPARLAEFDQIQSALPRVTVATIVLIVLILLVTFRALAPPLITLGAAAIAYTISVRVLAWVGDLRGQQVPKEVEPVLVALLLGLITDYALFFLARTRRHLQDGMSRLDAAARATRENLPIVLTAGLIVTLGSLALAVGKLEVFRSFGPGIALTVVVALAVALTLVPAALALLGRLAFWPSADRTEREPRERLWRVAVRRPAAAATTAVVAVALGIAALQLWNAHLGFTLVRGQPEGSEVKVAAEEAQRGFWPGITAPTEVLLEGDRLGARRERLIDLQRRIAAARGVARVIGPAEQELRRELPVFVARDGDAARYALILREEPHSAPAIDVLERLEGRLPQLLEDSGLGDVRVSVAGDTALAAETVDAIRSDGFRVGLAVLAVNLVLLAVFLRAIFAPLYLLAASVLALAASLGATTYMFQTLLGHDDLTYYVPFAAAVLLLSLGSDYNVFIVGRIWQEARARPLREAIAFAAPRSSATITVAGVTLAGSFALLALVPIRPMRELAFTMAIGILIDTFIVRSLLVPSLLALFGREREQRRVAHEPEGLGDLADDERPAHT